MGNREFSDLSPLNNDWQIEMAHITGESLRGLCTLTLKFVPINELVQQCPAERRNRNYMEFSENSVHKSLALSFIRLCMRYAMKRRSLDSLGNQDSLQNHSIISSKEIDCIIMTRLQQSISKYEKTGCIIM
ncbi:hypothetical protein O6H91_Y183800 [Diphasiastrum complanatum]|nr:hypothetical protein O6H91_Y183800 [Diphasiastrum complanatum]